MSGLKRYIYITLGTLFLVLGAIGTFIPLLPTVPFWLLTCWFYIRSSRRLYGRVMANRYFGGVVSGFMEDKSLTLRAKVFSLSVMWISAVLTCVFLIERHWVMALLLLVSAGVTYHILSFPTKQRKKKP